MSIYQAKHKARGRYGVMTPAKEWLADFLGNKDQAQAKADELNQKQYQQQPVTVVKTTNALNSNNNRKLQFTLTDKGWISKGE